MAERGQRDGEQSPPNRNQPPDVCLILEGSYPYVFGGVSGWTQSLIRSQPDLSFGVIAITTPDHGPSLYDPPENRREVCDIRLGENIAGPRDRRLDDPAASLHLAQALERLIAEATPDALLALRDAIRTTIGSAPIDSVLQSRLGWDMACHLYHRMAPGDSFVQFYWAWRALFGSLLSVLRAPIPLAGAYHAVTTGYAGLLAARAGAETGRPVVLTEHGIYTSERRIDLMLADWLHPVFDDAGQRDVAAFWVDTFESFARVCYASSRQIIALSTAGRHEQIMLGAPPERCNVIPNGVDADRFAAISRRQSGPPCIALLGRVVPIKDIHCFLHSVAALRHMVPDVVAVVAGPQDEDPDYHESCISLVHQLGLTQTVRFPGLVSVETVLSECDVLVLTSISESQPLALLEAGAAGIPCVATDVGACREILKGSANEAPPFGPGGFITRLAAPEDTAARIACLLRDPALRHRMGDALRQRVRHHYTADAMSAAYRGLYARVLAD